jgi:hypothetical protein
MRTDRRRQLLLVAVVLVLAGVIYQVWPSKSPAPSTNPAPSSNNSRPAPTRTAQPNAPLAEATPDVHLAALDSERTKPEPGERNLFRFRTKAAPPAPPPPPSRVTAPIAPPPAPVVQTGPPPPPPIPLKFIGLVEVSARAEKIAILSDGLNVPFYGREGDIIEGRYRILKIGVESVELAYVDGRGRQTIRLLSGG